MKTEIRRKFYDIKEPDETGLIPKEITCVNVDYEKGKVHYIYFYPSNESLTRRNSSREEREKIVNLLESSLQNSQ